MSSPLPSKRQPGFVAYFTRPRTDHGQGVTFIKGNSAARRDARGGIESAVPGKAVEPRTVIAVLLSARPSMFMSWERTLGEQSREVQDALAMGGITMSCRQRHARETGGTEWTALRGQDIYEWTVAEHGVAGALTAFKAAGVPGLNYRTDDGNENYTVFDALELARPSHRIVGGSNEFIRRDDLRAAATNEILYVSAAAFRQQGLTPAFRLPESKPWPQPRYPFKEGDMDYPWELQREVMVRLERGEDVILTGAQQDYARWWNEHTSAFEFDAGYAGPGVRVLTVSTEGTRSQPVIISRHLNGPPVGLPSDPLTAVRPAASDPAVSDYLTADAKSDPSEARHKL